jgi:hypothetical protein
MCHDVVEIVLGDKTVIVEVGTMEHRQKFLLIYLLSEILGDLSKFVNTELPLT